MRQHTDRENLPALFPVSCLCDTPNLHRSGCVRWRRRGGGLRQTRGKSGVDDLGANGGCRRIRASIGTKVCGEHSARTPYYLPSLCSISLNERYPLDAGRLLEICIERCKDYALALC